jgi:hypothetical protein
MLSAHAMNVARCQLRICLGAASWDEEQIRIESVEARRRGGV